MSEVSKFEFNRTRGLIWVCDVVKSSQYLNDDESVNNLEEFLPRLYWISNVLVESYLFEFVKWTGDGFLAWCPVPLYRDLGEKAGAMLFSSSLLSTIINVTQLGINTEKKIRIHHSLTFENDALLIRIIHKNRQKSLDLIGRSVVLAFRLSSIPSPFPHVVTQKEIVEAIHKNRWTNTKFKKRNFDQTEINKFFKGEKWGTRTIFTSNDKIPKSKSPRSVIKSVKKAIRKAEIGEGILQSKNQCTEHFVSRMMQGPQWCCSIMMKFAQYVEEDLLGNLKKILPLLEKINNANIKTK